MSRLRLNHESVGQTWGCYWQTGPSFLVPRDSGGQSRRVAVFQAKCCGRRYVRNAGCALKSSQPPSDCPSCASKKSSRVHGGTHTPEFQTWNSMCKRCRISQRDNPRFRNYAGRGIKVCDRWRGENGFTNFLSDMGPKPSEKHTIDRIDFSGDYSPENCRWVTAAVNNGNRRDCRMFTIEGMTNSLGTWCGIYGVPRNRVDYRLSKGMNILDALTTPSSR